MKSFRKNICTIIAFSILVTFILSQISVMVYAGPTFKDGGSNIEIITSAPAATTGIRFKTVGWNVTFSGVANYSIRLQNASVDTPSGDGMLKCTFTIQKSTLKDAFKKVAPDSEIELAFSKKFTLVFNAIIAVSKGGNLSGNVDSNGNISGTVYQSVSAISGAEDWSQAAKNSFPSYFNIIFSFDGIPQEPLEPPTAKISGKTVYNEGETVSLDGYKSTWPTDMQNVSLAQIKYYEWRYKKSTASTWTNITWTSIASSQGKATISIPYLTQGTYQVQLQIYYKFGEVLSPKSNIASVDVVIQENAENAKATIRIYAEPDKVVTQADIDANKLISVNVTAESTLTNFSDASRVANVQLHMRKDPSGAGDQYERFTSSGTLSISKTKSFTISAGLLKNQETFSQAFAAKAEYIIDGTTNIVSDLATCKFTLSKKPIGNTPPVASINADKYKIQTGQSVNIIDKSRVTTAGATLQKWEVKAVWTKTTGVNSTYVAKTTTTNPATFFKSYTLSQPGKYTFYINYVWDSNTLRSQEGSTVTIEVTNAPPPDPDPIPPENPDPEPEVPNKPPVPVISSPSSVKAGDSAYISGTGSYDTDGTITAYMWSMPGTSSLGSSSGSVTYMTPGTYSIALTVKDDKDATGSTSTSITVLPPTPVAVLTFGGKPKENRIVTMSAAFSTTPAAFPMDWSKTEWTVIPKDGALMDYPCYKVNGIVSGVPQGDIYTAGSFNGNKDLQVIFKKPGDYEIKLKVYNSSGLANEITLPLVIDPDLSPVADFTVQNTVLRDQVDENGVHYSIIQLYDASYSPDGDYITRRIWYYKYDSNNDGNFNDETWVIFDDGNNVAPYLIVIDVGRYQSYLKVVEGFDL